MKVAIVHYWFVSWRGGENVIKEILKIYPDADIFCHVYDRKLLEDNDVTNNIRTTFVGRLPFAKKLYKKLVFIMPYALEQLDLTDYDLIISSESGPAKNIISNPDSIHVCYCHSPMRYVWDFYYQYIKNVNIFLRVLVKPLIHYLKVVDRISADRVDHFIANSEFISKRIKKCYRRDSEVINPPVAVENFSVNEDKGDYYLVLGQLVAYKKPDLVIDAFLESGKNLL